MKSYIKITFSEGTPKEKHALANRILAKKLYPMSLLTYNPVNNKFSAAENSDIRFYYIPVVGNAYECILYWRKKIDTVAGNPEFDDLTTFIETFTNYEFDIEVINIGDYPDYYDLHKFKITEPVFYNWNDYEVERV